MFIKFLVFSHNRVQDMREEEGRLDAFVITPEGKSFPLFVHWV